MSWKRGEIVRFGGGKPEHRELRKVQTEPGQKFEEMHFFRLEWARRAGYPDSELEAGKTIEFEPKLGGERPQVGRFKPYEGSRPGGTKERGGEGGRVGVGTPDRRGGPAMAAGDANAPFLNPYHFIPLLAPVAATLCDADDLLQRGTLHDRFLPAAGKSPEEVRYSGRVVCRLETEGPVVLGGRQSKPSPDRETEVAPFELPPGSEAAGIAPMRPAIPGSSLRGLISSLVEAASCSALRVLPERKFTRRASIAHREALSEIGMIERWEGALKIRPLSRSVDEMTREAKAQKGRQRTAPADPKDRWRCLLNGYRSQRPGPGIEPAVGSFLETQKPKSWSAANRELWYADLNGARFHWSREFCTGLELESPPRREAEWEALPEAEKRRYARGILLVLGLDGSKARNLPHTKKHEYFLPFEEGGDESDLLDLPDEVCRELCRLALDAAKLPRGGDSDDLPYLHAGRDRPAGTPDEASWMPRVGDLVYFEREGAGGVRRVAYSALWRRRVGGSLHGSVALVSQDLVPFHAGRCRLTLAERLFGFVEANGKRALAGRLRFAHALAAGDAPGGDWYDPEVTLKILSAPKPPSPALYFGQHSRTDRPDLDLDRHSPQGRKTYLHHLEPDVAAGCYKSAEDARDPEARRKAKLKMKVRPLKSGVAFYFHVDFDNLDREELGFLLYALRPAPQFRHKIGLGKPLGLGRIRIDPLALCFVDREVCYRSHGIFAGKHAGCDVAAGAENAQDWRQLSGELAIRYRHERTIAASRQEPARSWPRIEELTAAVRSHVPETVRWALEHMGDPASAHAAVTYPVAADAPREGEHFHWFVNNDRLREGRQRLDAVAPGKPLPTLTPNRGR